MSAEFPVLVRDLFGEVCGCEERRAENVEPKAKAADRSVRAPKVYRDLDELECLATKVVGGLSYSAACFDKRFAREIRGVTKATEGQMAQVWRLVWRYRRQIQHEKRAELLAVAQVRAAEDFRTKSKL